MDLTKVIINNQEFPASEYQIEIFRKVLDGNYNIIVNAAAGSAKTTTMVNSLRFIKPNKKILLLAFNNNIVEKIIETTKENKNLNVMTFHSLGHAIFNENHGKSVLNEYKYKIYIRNNINTMSKHGGTHGLCGKATEYLNNIYKLVEYARYYLVFKRIELKRIAKMYGIDIIRDEIDVVLSVLEWGKNNIDEIDFTDMIWLPCVLNYNTKKFLSDWILIDEAQDTSIMQQTLVDKCFKRGARFMSVGDKHQQINVWCGASKTAIDNFKKKRNTIELNLPVSYRCPKSIVKLASKFSDNIMHSDSAIEGSVNYEVSAFTVKEGDLVLCRNTAPLIDLHLKYLKNNILSYLNNSENIIEDYSSLIRDSKSKTIDHLFLTKDGLFPKLYQMLGNKIEEKMKLLNIEEGDAIVTPEVLDLYDKIIGIQILSEGINTTEELLSKIETVFSVRESGGVKLSTVHRAKGLEADNVYILMPSLMPSKYATLDWEKETETNLLYVAITRAKKTLNFIKEDKENKNFNQFSMNMNEIKGSIKRYVKIGERNKELGVSESTVNPEKKLYELGDLKPVTNFNTKKRAGLRFSDID